MESNAPSHNIVGTARIYGGAAPPPPPPGSTIETGRREPASSPDGGKSPGSENDKKHMLNGASFYQISENDLAYLPPKVLGKINRSNLKNLARRLSAMADHPPDILMRGVLPHQQGELDAFNRGESMPEGARNFAITREISHHPYQQVSDIARNLHKAEQYTGNSNGSGGKIYAYTNSGQDRGCAVTPERDADRAAPGDVFDRSPGYAETMMRFDLMQHLTTLESEDIYRNGQLGRLSDFSQRYLHLESAHMLKNIDKIISAAEAKGSERPYTVSFAPPQQRGAFGRLMETVKSWC